MDAQGGNHQNSDLSPHQNMDQRCHDDTHCSRQPAPLSASPSCADDIGEGRFLKATIPQLTLVIFYRLRETRRAAGPLRNYRKDVSCSGTMYCSGKDPHRGRYHALCRHHQRRQRAQPAQSLECSRVNHDSPTGCNNRNLLQRLASSHCSAACRNVPRRMSSTGLLGSSMLGCQQRGRRPAGVHQTKRWGGRRIPR